MAFLPCSPTRLNLADLVRARPPRLESALEPLQCERHGHARARDDEESHEDLRALEGRTSHGHHLTHPELRGDELADDHTRERVSDSQPKARQDEGHGPWQGDRSEEGEVRRAERPRDL